MFKAVTPQDIAEIRKLISDDSRVQEGDAVSDDYCHDELNTLVCAPEVMVEPVSTEEVSALLRYAHSKNIPVTPRGQGTGLVGGCVPLQGGILINLHRMNKICSLDRDNAVLEVETGVLLLEIADFLKNSGLFYPPDPGEKSATIGGNVNTNAGGMRAVKYGVTRDYVRALEVVLPDGEVVIMGGIVAKNSSGYSLKDLIIGSEGTLGIVTRAWLRLIPEPKETLALLIAFPDLHRAITAVPSLLHSRIRPTAVEFMQREVIECAADYLGSSFPDASSDAYLIVSHDGNSRESLEKELDELAEIAIGAGAVDAFYSDTPERQESIWKTRGTFLEAIKASTTEMDECDVVIPLEEVADFIAYSVSLEKEFGVRILSFGHAGDGNLHLYLLRDDLDENDWHRVVEQVFAKMYERAAEIGGKVSGEHGIGFAKKSYLRLYENPQNLHLMTQVKYIFDVKGILNPGKVVQ